MSYSISRATPEEAADVHTVMHAAFDEYRATLRPPSSAHDETLEDVQHAMAAGGALLVRDGDLAVGSARYETHDDFLYVGRVSVIPAYRGKGIARDIMQEMESVAREVGKVRIVIMVRESLPSNRRLYERLDYVVTGIEPHRKGFDNTLTMEKRL